MSELPVFEEGLVAKPGDTLVLRVGQQMTDAELDQVGAYFKEFEDRHGIHVLVLDGFEQMTVVRKQDETVV